MLISRESRQLPTIESPFQLRVRYQILLAWMLQAVAVFLVSKFVLGQWIFTASAGKEAVQYFKTLIYCIPLTVLQILALRQFILYPGSARLHYILPNVLLSYGLLALLIFVLRAEYSRLVVMVSLLANLVWHYLDYCVRHHDKVPRIAVLPEGNLRAIMDTPRVDWQLLQAPETVEGKFDAVVADLRHDHPDHWARFVAYCTVRGMPVYDVKSILENLTGRVEIEHLSENTFGSTLPSIAYLRLKRSIDIIICLVLLVPVCLIVAVAAILIKLEDGGPVFFMQQRMGYQAQPFTIFKLRSMSTAKGEAKLYTEEGDSRITAIGQFIRKRRIDELPQLFNILRGDMSWIGPRPESIGLSEMYEAQIPFYYYRFAVRPGLTGWAQVNQGNVALVEAAQRKLEYDFYYIKHFSPWLDLHIILMTVRIVLNGFGAR